MKFDKQQEKARVAIVRALEELDLTIPSFANHGNLGSECDVVAWYAIELAMSKKGWVYSNLYTSSVDIQFRPREMVDTGDGEPMHTGDRDPILSGHRDP